MSGANYVLQQLPGVIILRDVGPWDQYLTITNDVERVVMDLAPILDDGIILLYYDSEGDVSEIRHKDGKFQKFQPAQILGDEICITRKREETGK